MNTVIEVQRTEPPRNGKKLATVLTAAGETYGIWPDKLPLLKVGQRYRVEISENEFRGKIYRKIGKVRPADSNGTRAPNGRASANSSNEQETRFVRELLAAAVHSSAISFSARDLRAGVAMLRVLWREMA